MMMSRPQMWLTLGLVSAIGLDILVGVLWVDILTWWASYVHVFKNIP